MAVPQPCPHCGTPLVPGAAGPTVFCPGCGDEVTLKVEVLAPQAASKKAGAASAGLDVRPAPGGPPISFQCRHCGQPFQAGSEDAGKRSRCPSCGNEIVVPTPAPIDASQMSGPPVELPADHRQANRTTCLLVTLAALASVAIWWSWWGLLTPVILLSAGWALRPRS